MKQDNFLPQYNLLQPPESMLSAPFDMLSQARIFKAENRFDEAVLLLENAKRKLGERSEPQGQRTVPIDLLNKSREHKKNRQFQRSIELLEEAKRAIA